MNHLKIYFLLLACMLLQLFSCREQKVAIHFYRFEQELFDPNTSKNPDHYLNLQKKYGPFYHSFAHDMLNISEEESGVAYSPSLNKFIHYPSLVQLKKEVDSVYSDMHLQEEQISDAIYIYRKHFPKEHIPAFVTFISEFGYANVTYDTLIGIGLDMYLGEKYPLYPALEFPGFMVAKLRKEYLVPNTIKSMAIGKFENQLSDKRFLAMMLFEGKVRYFMKQLLPEVSDTIIFAYTGNQLSWAKDNESQIWAHLIEKKLLFNAEPNQYMRYFNDGPFTIATGIPQESAPAIGVFMGYQIIEKYMENNSGITLKELMLNKDWDQILKDSKYKPN